MENEEIKRRLEGFEAVWKRVTAAKAENGAPAAGALELMPRKKPQSRAVRFSPPQK